MTQPEDRAALSLLLAQGVRNTELIFRILTIVVPSLVQGASAENMKSFLMQVQAMLHEDLKAVTEMQRLLAAAQERETLQALKATPLVANDKSELKN